MRAEFDLAKFWMRLSVVLAGACACTVLTVIAGSNFIVGALSDERYAVDRDGLASAASYFPNSARLNARLAEAELVDHPRDLTRAEVHATQAIRLSPFDYRFRLTLAAVEEARGDAKAAADAIKAAAALAPANTSVHWRLANMLVRSEKLGESIAEFKTAVRADSSLLPGALDLIWAVSGGSVGMLEEVAGDAPDSRLTLAQFLLKSNQAVEAVRIFKTIPLAFRRGSPKTGPFLDKLVAARQIDLAREGWLEIVGAGAGATLLWNGSFENRIVPGLSQFDWNLGRSEYATISVDEGVARSGRRSLRIDFSGRDTTRLNNEVRQLVRVIPGSRYTLECFVKTERLVTPGGPRVVVADTNSSWVADSEPVAAGSADWSRIAFDFVVPENVSTVLVSIRRKARFSYDEPTRGTMWFDDFRLTDSAAGQANGK